MQLAISGISIDYHGGVANQPVENEFRSYIFSDRGKNGINAELSETATFDATNYIITYKDLSFSVDENGIISFATTNNQNSYQWVLVADNDNDGVISGGDEIAPLINSIQDEHFYVFYNNSSEVYLITKLPVDYVTNSQSSTAFPVTYDMAYCNKEGEYETFIMPAGTLKGYEEYVEDIPQLDPSADSIDTSTIVAPTPTLIAVYYEEGETDQVHCTGTYTKAYRDRLVSAGLTLNNFSDSGCTDASIYDGWFELDSNDDDLDAMCSSLGDFWSTRSIYSVPNGLAPCFGFYGSESCEYYLELPLRITIMIDVDLIQPVN